MSRGMSAVLLVAGLASCRASHLEVGPVETVDGTPVPASDASEPSSASHAPSAAPIATTDPPPSPDTLPEGPTELGHLQGSSDVRFSKCETPRCTTTSQKKDYSGFTSVRTVLRRGALRGDKDDIKIANVCLEVEAGASGTLLFELGLRGDGIESMEMWDQQGAYGRMNRPTKFETSDPVVSSITDDAWKEDAILVRYTRKGGLSEHEGMHVLVLCRARGGRDVRSAVECVEERFVPTSSPDLEHPRLRAGVLTVHLRSMAEDAVGRAFTAPLAEVPSTQGLRSRP